MRTAKHVCHECTVQLKGDPFGRGQRGVALLLTVFGLLLLTAVAAAMLFSSNTETTISVNYRDKELASYAAFSGLLEARDRLQPLYGDLAVNNYVPTQLPGAANGQVFYIINPRAGESVKPWDPTNPYFDKELCQENLPTSLIATANLPGVPCGASQIPSPATCTPAGTAPTSWCSYYDNSTHNTNWKLKDASGKAVPLDYKWVRITLKSDKSAPVWIQTPGNAANGTQVCWDTRYNQQIQKPSTAANNCLGSSLAPVAAVNVINGGTGYTSVPTVTFSGGGGSGAAATAQLASTSGGMLSTHLTSPGSGYTSPPTVTITNPDGSGATFQAKVKGSPITGLSLPSSNYCYPAGTSNLSVGFNPSSPPTAGGSATATVAMTGQSCISGATATASCGNGNKNKTVGISYAGGFTGTVTLNNAGKVTGGAVTITNVGNYASVPGPQVIALSGVSGSCNATVSFNGGIRINSLNVTSGGEYISAPTATLTGTSVGAPTGTTQPAVSVSWTAGANNGQLSGVQVSNAGSGYSNNTPDHYILAFSGGGGSGAVGYATSSGVVTYVSGLTLLNGGSGYYTAPTVTISGGGGSGATGKATLLSGGQQLMLGRVYMLTAMASTRNGTQSMAQMETAVTPPWKFQLGGALTLAGPDPTFVTPNAQNLIMSGKDLAGSSPQEPPGCNGTPGAPLPAIGVYDSHAASCVIGGSDPNGQSCPAGSTGLGKPQNYIGAQNAPDIEVTSAANPDPSQLVQMVSDIASSPGAVVIPNTGCTSNCGSYTNSDISNYGSATNIQTIVVNGSLTLSGNVTGYGVLVVTGDFTLKGNFTWNGVVLVLGTANVDHNGGGNGLITGAMYVGNSAGSNLGSSSFTWNGGGTNTIQYDHCWADDLLNKYPPLTSDKALQILSTRTLSF